MKQKSKKPLWIALACVLAVVVVAVCLWLFWLRNLWGGNASLVYVQSVAEITGMNSSSLPRYSGVVEPQETYDITKDDSKTVAEIYITEGDQVSPGDALFRYDTQQMQLDLDQARLDLQGISNRIDTLKDQRDDLVKEKSTAPQEEQYAYTVQIQSVELQIKTEEYNAQVKQQDINQLEDSMANAEVFSDVAGVVKEVNETPSTDASGQQRPFISILSSGGYRVKGTVSELNIGSLYQGQAVLVCSRVDDAQTWSGTIDTIETEPTEDQNTMYYYGVDSGQQSSKYNFYVSLANLDGLILGQHVYIQPDVGQEALPEGLWLPEFYICQDDNGSYVWAQSDRNTLEKRSVILGEYDQDNALYEIEGGLSESDFLAIPEEGLQAGAPTTSDITQVPVEDPTLEDPSVDGSLDEGAVDDGTVDPGMAVPFTEENTGDVVASDTESFDTEDGEGTSSDSLEDSPMEGLAR